MIMIYLIQVHYVELAHTASLISVNGMSWKDSIIWYIITEWV